MVLILIHSPIPDTFPCSLTHPSYSNIFPFLFVLQFAHEQGCPSSTRLATAITRSSECSAYVLEHILPSLVQEAPEEALEQEPQITVMGDGAIVVGKIGRIMVMM